MDQKKKYLVKSIFFGLLVIGLALIGCKSGNKQNDQTKAFEQMQDQIISQAFGQGLRDAALNGNLTDVLKMLQQGADANGADEQGRTALMFAAYNGHSDVVKVLLEKKANVNAIDSSGRTALMYSASGPFPVTVDILIKAGANVNLVDNAEHWTALMFAASEGNTEVVKRLLAAGADNSLKDIDGEDAYDFAISNKHPETAKLLK